MGLSPGGALVLFGLSLFMYAARSALTCKLAGISTEVTSVAPRTELPIGVP